MKMSKLLSKSLFVLLISLSIISCKKDEEPEPINYDYENSFIEINQNSSYNQKNFSKSFAQITESSWKWAQSFSSHYDQNFKLELSIMNLSVFREFGMDYVGYQHFYNEQGVIIYSKIMNERVYYDNYKLVYEYDKQGYIIKLTVTIDDEIWDVANFEYDDEYRLKSKAFIAPTGEEYGLEFFTYNENGKISSWRDDNNLEEYSYDYNGNMIECKYFRNDEFIQALFFDYDDYTTVTKMYNEEYYVTYEYTNEVMIQQLFDDDKLMEYIEIGKGYKAQTGKTYYYSEDGVFDYCIQANLDELGFEDESIMYRGEINALEVVGKSIITERHIPSYRPIHQEFMNPNDELLYINECNVEEKTDMSGTYWNVTDVKWYLADETEIEESDITEDWVFELSRIFNYKAEKSKDNGFTSPKTFIERMHQ